MLKQKGGAQGAPTLKSIQIKTGVVKRTWQEWKSYEKERIAQQARIDALIASGADEHDIRKQREVLEETDLMIPDVQKRLVNSKAELSALLSAYSTANVGAEVVDPSPVEITNAESLLADMGGASSDSAPVFAAS